MADQDRTIGRGVSLAAAVALTTLLGAGCAHPATAPLSANLPPLGAGRSTDAVKTVYLTFDADMTPGMKARLEKKKVSAWYDQALIDGLRKEGVPATIFATGIFAEVYPDLLRELSADGRFSIQNHTYDHSAFAWPCFGLPSLKTDEQKREEIGRTQDIIEKVTGKRPAFFRYPGLCGNDPHDDAIVGSFGLTVNDGTLVSGDAFSRHPDRIIKTVLDHATDGSVIVMHLGGPNAPSTADAVAHLIPELRARGFRFAKL
jgi:peptidoglycan/xylan/chitin deacetylase (PgdA/CDA1 family)